MPKYVLCPRCEINYMLEGEKYCDVCKSELNISSINTHEEEDDMEICPYCKEHFKFKDQEMCEFCQERAENGEDIESLLNDDEEDEWEKDYVDEEELPTNVVDEDSEYISLDKMQSDEFEDDNNFDDEN